MGHVSLLTSQEKSHEKKSFFSMNTYGYMWSPQKDWQMPFRGLKLCRPEVALVMVALPELVWPSSSWTWDEVRADIYVFIES